MKNGAQYYGQTATFRRVEGVAVPWAAADRKREHCEAALRFSNGSTRPFVSTALALSKGQGKHYE